MPELNGRTGQGERRRSPREPVVCPCRLMDPADAEPTCAEVINLCPDGALVCVPAGSVPRLRRRLRVAMTLPSGALGVPAERPLTCEAEVVRHEMLRDNRYVGVAVTFEGGLDLPAS